MPKSKPKFEPSKGVLLLKHGKIDYDSQKKAAVVAGNIFDSTEDGVGVDLHLLRDSIDVLLERLYPGAPKGAICPVRLWIDELPGSNTPVVVLCAEKVNGEPRPGIVLATTRTVE